MRQEKVFILRLWCDSKQEDAWRASLETLLTKERVNFSTMEQLVDFLQANKQKIEPHSS